MKIAFSSLRFLRWPLRLSARLPMRPQGIGLRARVGHHGAGLAGDHASVYVATTALQIRIASRPSRA